MCSPPPFPLLLLAADALPPSHPLPRAWCLMKPKVDGSLSVPVSHCQRCVLCVLPALCSLHVASAVFSAYCQRCVLCVLHVLCSSDELTLLVPCTGIIMSIENEMTPEERHLESRQYWVVVDGRKYLPVEEVDHKFGRDGAMEDSSDSDDDGNEGSGGEGKQAGKKKKSKTRKSSSRRQRGSSVTNNSRLDIGEGEVYSDTDVSAALMGSPGLSEGRGPRRRPQTTRARSHARSHSSSVDSYNAGSARADAVAADSARH